MPNWHEIGRERDPELCRVARVFFGRPVETTSHVQVVKGKAAESQVVVNAEMFLSGK
jgi:hypothetical protein